MLRITGETDCLCACSCVLFWTCSAVSQILCFQASLPVHGSHGSLGAKAFDHLLPYQFDQVELVVLNTVADLWYDCIKQELECNPPAGGPIFLDEESVSWSLAEAKERRTGHIDIVTHECSPAALSY